MKLDPTRITLKMKLSLTKDNSSSSSIHATLHQIYVTFHQLTQSIKSGKGDMHIAFYFSTFFSELPLSLVPFSTFIKLIFRNYYSDFYQLVLCIHTDFNV